MRHLTFITGNKGKFTELALFLQSTDIQLVQQDVDLEELQEVDAQAIAEHKVKQALTLGYTNFILEDTSLYVDGMKNLPGPLIKWFLQELKTDGLYQLAKSMGSKKATAETTIVYAKSSSDIHYFHGKTTGSIVKPRGTNDFGWGPIFQPQRSAQTFAQLSPTEKHRWSMRIKAFKKLKTFLRSEV